MEQTISAASHRGPAVGPLQSQVPLNFQSQSISSFAFQGSLLPTLSPPCLFLLVFSNLPDFSSQPLRDPFPETPASFRSENPA